MPQYTYSSDFIVPPEGAGMRLDAALGLVFPQLGLRGRRRLFSSGTVTVNGKARGPGFFVAAGDAVSVCVCTVSCTVDLISSIRLIFLSDDFAVLAKPAGLHTAAIAAGMEASLEAALPQLWPALAGDGSRPPVLLTRLDNPTSGLVVAARSAEAERRFRRSEERGELRKTYAAVVQGTLNNPLVLRKALDTADRKKTKVTAPDALDIARHTEVFPLRAFELSSCSPATEVRVRIRRGARHQIRAHLADAGFPLVGETLYSAEDTGRILYLHHAKVETPEFAAECPPEWDAEFLSRLL